MTLEQDSTKILSLILDNDEVTLPGIGTFVCKLVPAYFSSNGSVLNPPRREISFRKEQLTDTCLCDFDLSPVRKALATAKCASLPGLGRLTVRSKGVIAFEAAEDIDIYPEGFGLKPVKVKPLGIIKKWLSKH